MLNGLDPSLADTDPTVDAVACLAAAAERLRAVRRAHERFLAMWAVDHLLGDPAAGERVRSDLDPINGADATAGDPDATSDNASVGILAKRVMFRGGRLDD